MNEKYMAEVIDNTGYEDLIKIGEVVKIINEHKSKITEKAMVDFEKSNGYVCKGCYITRFARIKREFMKEIW